MQQKIDTFLARQQWKFCPDELIRFDELFLSLKISTHNINSLKSNLHKLTNLMEYITQQNIDIFTITDTNLTDQEGFFTIHPQYKSTHRIF